MSAAATTPFRDVTPGSQPRNDFPEYGSTHKRHPMLPLLRTDPEGYAAAAEAIAAADLTDATSRLRLPALVIVGADDLATPPDSAAALAAAIPGARLVGIHGAAHIPTYEQEAAVTAAM